MKNNYYLDGIEIDISDTYELCYRVYTSMNGRDFDNFSKGKEARIIRIHIEYTLADISFIVKNVRICGTNSKTEIMGRPEISVPSYDKTKYGDEITEQDIYGEVYGIIERRVGKAYCDWFELELAENPVDGHNYDYYELTDRNGKIHVKANNGVSLASGIHYYLKYFCKVHISQVGDQVKMPEHVIPVSKVLFRETKAKIRYAYNYCSFSYSMAFYGRKEWRRFLKELGYSHEDIKHFIVGPAYYAWAYMANLSGFGGPVHDSWFEERVELARENHRIMRTLGIQPVLQGYSGMVPNDILDNLANNIPNAFNQCSSIAGIGIAPEASANNPVLYDFLFETIWQENAESPMKVISLKEWLMQYAERRYGASSVGAEKAWEILLETVYKAEWNHIGQGAPECIAIARPAQKIRATSAWGNTVVSYDMKLLEQAKTFMMEDYELLKGSAGYLYDVVTIQQQVLSNKSLECYQEMIKALENQQAEVFDECAKQFLQLIDEMEQVTAFNEYNRLDRWIGQAERLAEHADDFSRKMYVWNAKMLITTWGSYEQSEKGKLHDYSNRQWSGLIKDFYKPRWQRWIEERRKELRGEVFEDSINWFEWEWNWTRS